MIDFTSKSPTKAQLANMRTGDTYEFTLNPSEIDRPWGANVSEDAIPGFSDPLLRFASGKVKEIKFKLQLSGEMRLRFYPTQFANGLNGATGLVDYNIQGELDFLRAASSNTDPASGGDGGLDRFTFTCGIGYPKTVVFVVTADAKEKRFDSDMNPTEADVNVVLKRIIDKNLFANQIWTR